MTGSHVDLVLSLVPGDDSLERSSGETGRADRKPKNAEAFDKHNCFGSHCARKEDSRPEENTTSAQAPCERRPDWLKNQLIARLYFDSLDALKAGLASPQGKATAADLVNFADGGADLYLFDTKEA